MLAGISAGSYTRPGEIRWRAFRSACRPAPHARVLSSHRVGPILGASGATGWPMACWL